MKPGQIYETEDHASCLQCGRHWARPIECEALKPEVYHRKVRDLGPWRVVARAGSSFLVWTEYDNEHHDNACPHCVGKRQEREAQPSLF